MFRYPPHGPARFFDRCQSAREENVFHLNGRKRTIRAKVQLGAVLYIARREARDALYRPCHRGCVVAHLRLERSTERRPELLHRPPAIPARDSPASSKTKSVRIYISVEAEIPATLSAKSIQFAATGNELTNLQTPDLPLLIPFDQVIS